MIKEELEEKKDEILRKRDRISELNRTNKRKSMVISLLIVLFISSWMIIPNLGREVDESEFCLKKLNKYFPEYNFYQANYIADTGTIGEDDPHDYSCKGTYYVENDENLTTRDGLKEVGETKTTETKYFKLIDQRDIDYMNSDNFPTFFLYLGSVVLLVGLYFIWVIYFG